MLLLTCVTWIKLSQMSLWVKLWNFLFRHCHSANTPPLYRQVEKVDTCAVNKSSASPLQSNVLWNIYNVLFYFDVLRLYYQLLLICVIYWPISFRLIHRHYGNQTAPLPVKQKRKDMTTIKHNKVPAVYTGQVTKARLPCYLVLLSVDSKTR